MHSEISDVVCDASVQNARDFLFESSKKHKIYENWSKFVDLLDIPILHLQNVGPTETNCSRKRHSRNLDYPWN